MNTQENTANRSVREDMRGARVTVSEAAEKAGVSPNTWRLFEASREAVSDSVRARCDATHEWIRALAKARAA